MTSGEMSADGLRWCADCAIIFYEGMRFGRDIEPSPVLKILFGMFYLVLFQMQ